MAFWFSEQFHVARLTATAMAFALAAPGAYIAWRSYRDDRAEALADTDALAKALAAAVAAAETRQRAQLIGPGAHRIDLDFDYQQELANNAAGAGQHGQLTGVIDYYRHLRPARLVITGEPGAGKTMLALELLLGLLSHSGRSDADPVPVRVSLTSWDTTFPLEDWLAGQVYDQFRKRGISIEAARALVEQRRVLPVLDGLDEMDTATTPIGHRRAARVLEQLNFYQGPVGSAPVILTCRAAQYSELAALDVRMREAARIAIAPLDHTQATAYLTARSINPNRWTPVLEALDTDPSGVLARALNTPWRLNLAAAAYEERDSDTLAFLRDPADLLTLASDSDVREHLLALYLPAAVSQHPTQPERYRPDQVHRWLAWLAVYLTTTAPTGTDLAIHELFPRFGPRRTGIADILLVTFLSLCFSLTFLNCSFTRTLPAATVSALFGVLTAWQVSRVSLRGRGLAPREFQQLLWTLARAPQAVRPLVLGAGLGLCAGLTAGFAAGPDSWLGLGLGLGTFLGLAGGQELGRTDPAVATGRTSRFTARPRHPVRDGFNTGLASGLSLAFIAWSAVLVVTGPGNVPVGLASALMGALAGTAYGSILGLYGLSASGRRYLTFLRYSFGHLPSATGAFLEWAYAAGLLRMSGTSYQFRHRELQDWFASRQHP
ncbi:NACHT domain-containing protein [Streptomyces fagopyri]|uniref:NACHT domain-containing protein n=1 Tax=Streptomyces fagopyri TaxID=2662397 RepID=UPI0033FA9326